MFPIICRRTDGLRVGAASDPDHTVQIRTLFTELLYLLYLQNLAY